MRFRTIPWKRNQLRTKHGSRLFQKFVGFGHACAPWAARPVALGSLTRHLHCFLFIPKNTKLTISTNKLLPFRPELGVYLSTGPPRLWCIIFPATHPTHRTLLSYAAPYSALLHPKDLFCTLLSYAASSWDTLLQWATMHPIELCCTLLMYVQTNHFVKLFFAAVS